MNKIVFLVILLTVKIGFVESQDEGNLYEYYPCIDVDKVFETFSDSDPYAFNVTILLSKYDLLPAKFKLNVILKFDSLSDVKYNFDPLSYFSNGYEFDGNLFSVNGTDIVYTVSPYVGTDKVPNLISVKLNDQEICINGVQKDMWKNFVKLTPFSTTTTTFKPVTTSDTVFEDCGRRPNQNNPFITHGYKGKPGDWPWHSAIYRLQTKNSQLAYTCGGTLVSKTRVLTAGHCVVEYGSILAPERIYVALGKYNFIGDDHGLQEKRVFEVNLHPEYSQTNLTNDIAILKLSSEVTFTEFVTPICLKDIRRPDKTELFGQMGYVVGWGRDEHGKHSKQLIEARMPIKSDLECYKKDSSFFSIFLNDGNFCVGYENGTNVCNGDSGGGLFIPFNTSDGSNLWYLRGIISLGAALHDKTICDPKHYTIFTDVAHFMDFIKIHI